MGRERAELHWVSYCSGELVVRGARVCQRAGKRPRMSRRAFYLDQEETITPAEILAIARNRRVDPLVRGLAARSEFLSVSDVKKILHIRCPFVIAGIIAREDCPEAWKDKFKKHPHVKVQDVLRIYRKGHDTMKELGYWQETRCVQYGYRAGYRVEMQTITHTRTADGKYLSTMVCKSI